MLDYFFDLSFLGLVQGYVQTTSSLLRGYCYNGILLYLLQKEKTIRHRLLEKLIYIYIYI